MLSHDPEMPTLSTAVLQQTLGLLTTGKQRPRCVLSFFFVRFLRKNLVVGCVQGSPRYRTPIGPGIVDPSRFYAVSAPFGNGRDLP